MVTNCTFVLKEREKKKKKELPNQIIVPTLKYCVLVYCSFGENNNKLRVDIYLAYIFLRNIRVGESERVLAEGLGSFKAAGQYSFVYTVHVF